MTGNPLISVITVTYNASHVIGKTLLSLQKQKFHDFEHLVIDGASKDNTVEIIKELGVPETKIISEKDNGLYDAMNKGLRLARGKYVLFLNAGDSLHNEDTLASYAAKCLKDADIIYGNTLIYDMEGKCIGPRHLSPPDTLNSDSFSNGMLICHQAFMVKKALAPKYDLAYRFSSDYDWCIRCISSGDPKKFINLNQITIDYLSDGLTDKNKITSLKERFRIMTKHYGLPKTIGRHIGFIFRALKRGSL